MDAKSDPFNVSDKQWWLKQEAPTSISRSGSRKSEIHAIMYPHHIQMIDDNYCIKRDYREKFPQLYEEIAEHDKVSNFSWYDLSEEAYQQYQEYASLEREE